MKLNTPWVKDIEKAAQNDYENSREVLSYTAGISLPAWEELPADTRRELEYQQGDRERKVAERPLITLKSVSSDVWAPGVTLVLGKETYSIFRCYLGWDSHGIFAGHTQRRNKIKLKQVDSFKIEWIHADPEFKLRLIVSFDDYTKETIEGVDTIFSREDLKPFYQIIRESAEYMSYYDHPMPKNFY